MKNTRHDDTFSDGYEHLGETCCLQVEAAGSLVLKRDRYMVCQAHCSLLLAVICVQH